MTTRPDNYIDEKGNTIFHRLSLNEDEKGLRKIKKDNPSFVKKHINTKNHAGQTPLHVALEANIKSGKDQDFISFLVKEMGANPHEPDNQNRIIAGFGTTTENRFGLSTDSLSQSPELKPHHTGKGINPNPTLDDQKEVARLNQNYVIEHGKKPSSGCNAGAGITDSNESQTDQSIVKFVRDLNAHYGIGDEIRAKIGGKYSGRRIIANSSEKNQMTRKYIGSDENSFEFVKDSTDEMEAGSDEFNIGVSHLSKFSEGTRRMINSPNSDSMALDGGKWDPVLLDRHKVIVQKIMEYLSISEEDAKLYRTLIKLNLIKEHPELAGPTNDAIRTQEIEKIVSNKENLEKYWNKFVKPNLADLKAHIEHQKELSTERRRLKAEKMKEKKKAKKQQKKTAASSDSESVASNSSDSSEEKPKARKTKAKAEAKPEAKPKVAKAEAKPKATKPKAEPKAKKAAKTTKKIAENGYIKSDEKIYDMSDMSDF